MRTTKSPVTFPQVVREIVEEMNYSGRMAIIFFHNVMLICFQLTARHGAFLLDVKDICIFPLKLKRCHRFWHSSQVTWQRWPNRSTR